MLRPYGLFADDLEIDFNDTNRPRLVTRILECCTFGGNGSHPAEDFFWDLTVGKRIECLLTIALTNSKSSESFPLRCRHEKCREMMEIEISLRDIFDLQRHADDSDYFDIISEGKTIRMRKPTGADQLKWQSASQAGKTALMTMIVETLMCRDEKVDDVGDVVVSDAVIGAVNRIMDKSDPLVNLTVTVCCPICGREDQRAIDLEEHSIRKLREAQNELVRIVHRLAAFYGWSESQVLSLPPRRRYQYLGLIEQEARQ